jgi:UrcA family protein
LYPVKPFRRSNEGFCRTPAALAAPFGIAVASAAHSHLTDRSKGSRHRGRPPNSPPAVPRLFDGGIPMRVLIASLALGAIALSTSAAAQPIDDNAVARIVQYADLNLDSPAGMATLNGRIRAAADQLCSDYVISPVERPVVIGRCKAQVIRSAERQLEPRTAMAGTGSPRAGY